MYKYLLLSAAVLLVGCETTDQKIIKNTLAGNPRIPDRIIQEFFEAGKWVHVKNHPYDAYVILRGGVERDHSITINAVLESYPDNSWIEKAKEFAKEAKITPVNVGSRTPPIAEVYVIFYESEVGPNEAIVFASQKSTTPQAAWGGTNYFVLWNYEE